MHFVAHFTIIVIVVIIIIIMMTTKLCCAGWTRPKAVKRRQLKQASYRQQFNSVRTYQLCHMFNKVLTYLLSWTTVGFVRIVIMESTSVETNNEHS